MPTRNYTWKHRDFRNHRKQNRLTDNYSRMCVEISSPDAPPCINFEICLKLKKLLISSHYYDSETVTDYSQKKRIRY